MKKLPIALAVATAMIFTPAAEAQTFPKHPSEIEREQNRTPLERLQGQALMSMAQHSFLGFVIADAVVGGYTAPGMAPLQQCAAQTASSSQIQPVVMLATHWCMLTNPGLKPAMPEWYY